MMQQLRATAQRFDASVTRVADAAISMLKPFGFTTGTTLAWNVEPCVQETAIRTHGKRYQRRLQETLT